MARKKTGKAVNPRKSQIKELEVGLINNGMAMIDNENHKKRWTIQDMRVIRPLNNPQNTAFELYFSGNHLILDGSAGTGKTFAAMFLAFNDVLSSKSPQKKIIIVRSAVSTRDLGHLPGDVNEKLEPYERPYKDIVHSLTGNPNDYDNMKRSGIIEFMPTSFIRGLNWDDAVIIVDEVQNLNFSEINSVITRVGDESKVIIVGDQIQTDLYKSHNDKSGMDRFLKVAQSMNGFEKVVFYKEDIIRSNFVKSWITALEEYDQ